MHLLFVCLGNICRSPTAEGVMADLVERGGLAGEITVDSAGTGSWHVGGPADERATAAAARRGIALTSRARQVTVDDFAIADLIVAMDGRNAEDLRALAPDDAGRAKVRLLRSFDPGTPAEDQDVPDPYTGGPEGFELVLDQVAAGCEGLLAEVRRPA
ncbi:low molecular weight protein-tyrosine-phosphatase [Patulibacter sp.]|uniref:low molecular weight protein-tyrosine-phosphatase n=1 Tax=Patulibacter sp. TaxID=1912859 RepID=UPI00271F1F59|nr:low molecular weight protein-tyrosine-phosphatase [Patulibacter sp.]MDO9410222.1 low molecular weight protein-tyrosine-phosphatase [Patulibacter sp.]